jgi:hypothetical protein
MTSRHLIGPRIKWDGCPSKIYSQLPTAKGWDRLGGMLVRTWQFPSSRRALEFVSQVPALADRVNHYPGHYFELPHGPGRAFNPLRRRPDQP